MAGWSAREYREYTVDFSDFQKSIDYQFKNGELLLEALTHKSYANEAGEGGGHNERLEFLGDAVLDLAVGALLMQEFPQLTEGDLSRRRAFLVNEDNLASVAEKIQLAEFLRLGKGEVLSGGQRKPRILCSTLEAVFGAVFLDGGYEVASELAAKLLASKLAELSDFEEADLDYKTKFQELVQKHSKTTPEYRITGTAGPDHNRVFTANVLVKNRVCGEGRGNSKKVAEQRAAEMAWKKAVDGGAV